MLRLKEFDCDIKKIDKILDLLGKYDDDNGLSNISDVIENNNDVFSIDNQDFIAKALVIKTMFSFNHESMYCFISSYLNINDRFILTFIDIFFEMLNERYYERYVSVFFLLQKVIDCCNSKDMKNFAISHLIDKIEENQMNISRPNILFLQCIIFSDFLINNEKDSLFNSILEHIQYSSSINRSIVLDERFKNELYNIPKTIKTMSNNFFDSDVFSYILEDNIEEFLRELDGETQNFNIKAGLFSDSLIRESQSWIEIAALFGKFNIFSYLYKNTVISDLEKLVERILATNNQDIINLFSKDNFSYLIEHIYYAVKYHNNGFFDYITDEHPTKIKTYILNKCLLESIRSFNYHVFIYCINSDIDINITDHLQKSPLLLAAEYNNTLVLSYILNYKGTDINHRDINGIYNFINTLPYILLSRMVAIDLYKSFFKNQILTLMHLIILSRLHSCIAAMKKPRVCLTKRTKDDILR